MRSTSRRRCVAGIGALVATFLAVVAGPPHPSRAGSGAAAAQLKVQPILFETNRNGNSDIYAMDERGRGQAPVVTGPAAEEAPDWSPDGRSFAFTSDRDGTWQLYVQGPDGQPRQLTRDRHSNLDPVWSPDGKRIAFETNRGGNWQIYVMDADGSKQRTVSDSARNDFDPAWNPDARRVAFARVARRRADLYQVDVDTGRRERLTATRTAAEFEPAFSPTGDRLAFSRVVRHNYDIYVRTLRDGRTTRLTRGRTVDESPSFSPDGRALLFTAERREGDREVERISTRGGGRLILTRGQPRDDSAADWRPGPARPGRAAAPPALQADHFPFTCGDPDSTGTSPPWRVRSGDNGDDRLCGRHTKRDWLRGFDGRDHLDARHHEDKLEGGRAADWIYAKDDEADRLYGGTLTSSGHRDFSKKDWARIDKHLDDPLSGIDRPR